MKGHDKAKKFLEEKAEFLESKIDENLDEIGQALESMHTILENKFYSVSSIEDSITETIKEVKNIIKPLKNELGAESINLNGQQLVLIELLESFCDECESLYGNEANKEEFVSKKFIQALEYVYNDDDLRTIVGQEFLEEMYPDFFV